jgi:predicted NodU family carbamoyl transferase
MVIPLVRDGVLVAAAEEERFRRVKHWAGLPAARELSQRSREHRASSTELPAESGEKRGPTVW